MEHKNEFSEDIEWLNDKEGVLKSENKMPILDGKNRVGTKAIIMDAKISKEAIVENLTRAIEQRDDSKKTFEAAERQLELLGDKTALTSEEVLIQRAVEKIMNQKQIGQLTEQRDNLKQVFEEQEEYCDRRTKMLARCPKSN